MFLERTGNLPECSCMFSFVLYCSPGSAGLSGNVLCDGESTESCLCSAGETGSRTEGFHFFLLSTPLRMALLLWKYLKCDIFFWNSGRVFLFPLVTFGYCYCCCFFSAMLMCFGRSPDKPLLNFCFPEISVFKVRVFLIKYLLWNRGYIDSEPNITLAFSLLSLWNNKLYCVSSWLSLLACFFLESVHFVAWLGLLYSLQVCPHWTAF